MQRKPTIILIASLIFFLSTTMLVLWEGPTLSAQTAKSGGNAENLDWQLPRESLRLPWDKEQPIYFVSTKTPAAWAKLPSYWNTVSEVALHPVTGKTVERTVIKIKLPLGLTQPPQVPQENPMTVAGWELGRRLYFDPVLSSDDTVSCATCHDPKRGFTDQSAVSVGIKNLKGGVSAPTVMNSAFNLLQFWDGRAASLEEQAQGPPQNPVEMFDGSGHAWNLAVQRVRKKSDYSQRFQEAFGTEPTCDTIAKAIATYERTVLNGNSIHDRAEVAMRMRVAAEGGSKFSFQDQDYEKVLKEAFLQKDSRALSALGLDVAKDPGKAVEVAKQINAGRALFFGKARCSLCHAGENFTDNQFHNLGVGVDKDGKLPADGLGRFARLPTGHKNPALVGAFKTPTLRGLVSTAPYMHDGNEKTLEEVVDFYNDGGNINEYLAPNMRDLAAEKAYLASKAIGPEYSGPKVRLVGPDQKPMVPARLKLTPAEKAALVLFLRALEGEVAALVADPKIPVPTR